MGTIKDITVISANYYPEDTAIGLYSKQWVDYLVENGYKVSVITAFPYYPKWEISKEYRNKKTFLRENIDNSTILRYKQYVPKNPTFIKRVVHLIDFTVGSFFNLYKIRKCDLVISIVPFTSSVFLGYIQKKRFKAKLWMHIQDFEFDAALQTGVGKKKNIIFKLLFKLEKWLFSKPELASTISYSMLNRLAEKTNSNQFFLPNWIDEEKINPVNSKPHQYLQSSKTKILYSGNIGDKQDWEVFIKFCKDLDSSKFDVTVVGDGSKKAWLVEQIEKFDNVSYYPPVPFEELSDLLCSADVHILFQKTEVVDTVMPSKVLGMMASAKPSIIIGNDQSEVKSIFEESHAGLYFSEYSEPVIQGLERLSKSKEQLEQKGISARNYVIEHFSKDKILSKMLDKLQKL